MSIVSLCSLGSSHNTSFQVSVDLGLADHICQDKRADIPALADYSRPARHAGWFSYITKAYGTGSPTARPCAGQGTLVVSDDE